MDLGISEIFASIQGEGQRIGILSTFIRLEGCNLHCKWCDTPKYDSDPDITNDTLKYFFKEYPHNDIVITGGEPLLNQLKTKHILRQAYFALGKKHPLVTIETNCTITPSRAITNFSPRIIWSVSPKLGSSGETYNQSAFDYFATLKNVQFKFVIANLQDFQEFTRLIWDIGFDTPIVVQPACPRNATFEKYMSMYRELFEFVKSEKLMHTIQVLPQLHKLAFGFNTEGV